MPLTFTFQQPPAPVTQFVEVGLGDGDEPDPTADGTFQKPWRGLNNVPQLPEDSELVVIGDHLYTGLANQLLMNFWNHGVTLRGQNLSGFDKPHIDRAWRLANCTDGVTAYSNITIQNLSWQLAAFRDWELSPGVENPPANRSSDLTFVDCVFRGESNSPIDTAEGNDNFTFTDCDFFTDTNNASPGQFYSQKRYSDSIGGDNPTFTRCYFRTTNRAGIGVDGHAIGLRQLNAATVRECLIEDIGGAAIEAFRGSSGPQTNVVVEDCEFRNTRNLFSSGGTGGRAFAGTGDNNAQTMDRTGWKVDRNKIRDTEGDGTVFNMLGSNAPEINQNHIGQSTVASEHCIYAQENNIAGCGTAVNPFNNVLYDAGRVPFNQAELYVCGNPSGTLNPTNTTAPISSFPPFTKRRYFWGDGVDAYVSCHFPDGTLSEFSLGGWFRRSEDPGEAVACVSFSRLDDSGNFILLQMDASGQPTLTVVGPGGTLQATFGNPVATGAWSFLGVENRANNDRTLYQDGLSFINSQSVIFPTNPFTECDLLALRRATQSYYRVGAAQVFFGRERLGDQMNNIYRGGLPVITDTEGWYLPCWEHRGTTVSDESGFDNDAVLMNAQGSVYRREF